MLIIFGRKNPQKACNVHTRNVSFDENSVLAYVNFIASI